MIVQHNGAPDIMQHRCQFIELIDMRCLPCQFHDQQSPSPTLFSIQCNNSGIFIVRISLL